MLSVKGVFQNGVVRPVQPVEASEGQSVIIIFLDEGVTSPWLSVNESDWDAMLQLVEECAVETGITDLAHQHDHYLYNKPKKE
jgi:predicted DNA-binding antitoxin AbrB/MazE fold protein